jgi:hypothetical protein
MGGSAGFAALNVVQQDALSKALNMTSDELANSMLYQENLAQLGEEEKQRVIEQIDLLESKGNTEAAQQLQRAVAADADINAALKASTIQDEFYANVEKIKTAIQQIAEGPAMKLADSLSNMVGSTYALKGALAIVAGILAAMVISFAIMNPVAALVGLGVAAGVSLYMDSNEPKSGVVPGHGAGGSWENGGVIPGNSYKGDNVKANVNSGEMILNGSQQKNLFDIANNKDSKGNNNQDSKGNNNQDLSALTQAINGLRINKKDNIITGTNPGGRDNINQYSPAMLAAINELNSNVIALASRPIYNSIQMDTEKVMKAQSKFQNTQGDLNRETAFNIS